MEVERRPSPLSGCHAFAGLRQQKRPYRWFSASLPKRVGRKIARKRYAKRHAVSCGVGLIA